MSRLDRMDAMAKRTPQPESSPTPPRQPRGRSRAKRPANAGDSVAARTGPGTDKPADPGVLDSVSRGSEPSEDDIRLRAYHRYLSRGAGHGLDFDDWLEAERELRGKP